MDCAIHLKFMHTCVYVYAADLLSYTANKCRCSDAVNVKANIKLVRRGVSGNKKQSDEGSAERASAAEELDVF